MKQYHEMLQHILDHGNDRGDRTGTGTRGVFGYQNRYNLQDGFPAVTTKKLFLRGIVHELLWFLKGDTNIKYLVDNNVGIWNEWPYKIYKEATGDDLTLEEFVERIRTSNDFAAEWGGIGPGYGSQWRKWPAYEFDDDPTSSSYASWMPGEPIDQIANVIEQIKNNPESRRLIVSAWNVAEVDEMALPPCHTLFQFYTETRPWEDIIDDIIEADLLDLWNVTSEDMSSEIRMDHTWIPASGSGIGYRHPEYYNEGMIFAKLHGIKTRKLSCQLYQRKEHCALAA